MTQPLLEFMARRTFSCKKSTRFLGLQVVCVFCLLEIASVILLYLPSCLLSLVFLYQHTKKCMMKESCFRTYVIFNPRSFI